MSLSGLNGLLPGGATALALVLYVMFASTLTYLAFGLDKQRAVAGAWRLPERRLLMLAAVGGWPGAKLAQRRFRHKTRKEPFRSQLNLIGVMHAAVVVLLMVPLPAPDGLEPLLRLVWSSPVREEVRQAPEAAKRTLPRRFGPGATMP